MARSKPRSATSILAEANSLARSFYGMMGYQVSNDFTFHDERVNRHPQEELVWAMVTEAYYRLRDTDLHDVAAEAEDDAPVTEYAGLAPKDGGEP